MGSELSDFELNILSVVFPVVQWLGASNSCINPILYAFLNKKFRTGFLALIRSRSCCGTIRSDVYTDPMMRCSSYYSSKNPVVGGNPFSSAHNRKSVVYSIPRHSVLSNSPRRCQSFENNDYLQTNDSFHVGLKSYHFRLNRSGLNNTRRTSSMNIATIREDNIASTKKMLNDNFAK